jgi:hypothetical protein
MDMEVAGPAEPAPAEPVAEEKPKKRGLLGRILGRDGEKEDDED